MNKDFELQNTNTQTVAHLSMTKLYIDFVRVTTGKERKKSND